jgi:NAD(P)-dependent dehydrogenase (short-subunit alcohol dehydrogenase family)
MNLKVDIGSDICMDYDFSNKVVIVTGGGKGIGRTTVKEFSKYGAKVVIVDIDEKLIKEVQNEIIKGGGEALAIKVDVSNRSEVINLAEETLNNYNQIDILVNNAGVLGYSGMVMDHPEESWDRVLNVNLKGTFLCCQAVLPHMINRKYGSIINIGSMAGSTGATPAVGVDYAVSKAGVHCLTKRMATETADKGIRVNALAPNGIRTDMFNSISKEFYNKVVSNIKMGRLAETSELTNVILFLASDESSFITGQTIHVDGGSVYGD